MTEIQFKANMDVQLIDHMGSDRSIVAAMMVSTQGDKSQAWFDPIAGGHEGRINFLMKNRHGTPFEHAAMTFYIAAPIFVFREFHRHRIGWSYNEESGRYKQLAPVFYIPASERPLVQQGKPGAYDFVPGSYEQYQATAHAHRSACRHSYELYEAMLEGGIAKEVARMTLPVNIFSSMYATCNPRSMMAFLSLRKKWDDAKFPSFPMREIEMVAESLAVYFEALFPLTYRAFIENGSVSP